MTPIYLSEFTLLLVSVFRSCVGGALASIDETVFDGVASQFGVAGDTELLQDA